VRVAFHVTVPNSLRATRQWVPIALPLRQDLFEVKLVTARGEFDVTHNNAVAALRPLTLRLGMDAQLRSAVGRGRPQLQLVDRTLGRVIGVLELIPKEHWEAAGALIGLFEVRKARHYCAHRLRRTWDAWMYRRSALRAPAHKQLMAVASIEPFIIFHLCPRPLFLVGVNDGRHSNLFPMDLVGHLEPGKFTLALRCTSASVETIKSHRRVALSDVPASACEIVYPLGVHHRKPPTDWQALPFKTLQSQLFALPVPDFALRVRELEILDFRVIGSHTLFVGRICSEHSLAAGHQLFHASGLHQRLRSRHHHPFEEAGAAL
jgi:flavin reductase (DIM6/NTAB) family NADH-FMN oxidoreductase RutF